MTEILNATDSPVPAGDEMPAGGGEHYQTGTIVTSRFSLGPSVHARQSIMRKAARFWMAAALPLAALVIGGLVYDSRLLFVGAVMMFILFPALLFFGWYGTLTRPWAVASLFPHRVVLDVDNELTVEYYPMPGRDSAPPGELVIQSGEVSGCHFIGRNVIVSYGGGRELIIPVTAFAEPQAALAFQRRLEVVQESPRRQGEEF